MSEKDRTFTKTLLIIASILQILACLTIVSNLGWAHTAAIASYLLTLIVGYVIYILWKN